MMITWVFITFCDHNAPMTLHTLFRRRNLYLYFPWRHAAVALPLAMYNRRSAMPSSGDSSLSTASLALGGQRSQRGQRHLTRHRGTSASLPRFVTSQHSSSDELGRRISSRLRHSRSRPAGPAIPTAARRRSRALSSLAARADIYYHPVGDARLLRRPPAGSRSGAGGAASAAALLRRVAVSRQEKRAFAPAAFDVGEKQQAAGGEIAPCLLINELLMKASRMRCCRNRAIEQN